MILSDLFITDMNSALGTVLVSLREDKGNSAVDMAEILNVTISTYRAKEKGDSSLSTVHLAILAKYFGLFPSDILSMAEQLMVNRGKTLCNS